MPSAPLFSAALRVRVKLAVQLALAFSRVGLQAAPAAHRAEGVRASEKGLEEGTEALPTRAQEEKF
jgi:hypothetical protein